MFSGVSVHLQLVAKVLTNLYATTEVATWSKLQVKTVERESIHLMIIITVHGKYAKAYILGHH